MSVEEAILKLFKKARTKRLRHLKRELYKAEHVRYYIQFQWRNPNGCQGDPRDFRSWRVFAAMPILFHTREEAWEFIREVPDIFADYRGCRKVSCSVEHTRI
jgi:hypothetical protein